MANSGSQTLGVGSHWDLIVEWTAKQDIGKNKSTVTVELFWKADSYGAVNSSATKSGWIEVNGSRQTFSATAGLSNGQKKRLSTKTFDVAHNTDGSKSIVVEGNFGMEVTLGDTYYGSRTVTDASTALNPIPRESSMSTSPSWTIATNRDVSITRYSSSFTHEVEIYVGTAPSTWNWIKRLSFGTGDTKKSTAFTDAEMAETLTSYNSGSRDTKMVVQTFKSGDLIGSKTYEGTLSILDASTTTTTSSFTMGGTFAIGINRDDSQFKHTIRLKNGGTTLKTYTDQTTSCTFDTASIKTTLLGLVSNKTYIDLTIEITTYLNGVQLASAKTETIRANVDTNAEKPTFTGAVTWADTNSTITAITGNNQYIVQNKSTLTVTLPSTALATAKTGTTMKSYTVIFNGTPITQNHVAGTTLTFVFTASKLDVSTNQIMQIKATDNRNVSTTVTKTVLVVPYKPPTMNVTAFRNSGFDNPSTITLEGTMATAVVNTVPKNAIVSLKYATKLATASTYGTAVTFTNATATFPAYKATPVTNLDLQNTNAFDIKFIVQDKFGTYETVKTIPVGRPIFFIDSEKKSVGINTLPTENEALEVNRIVLAKNSWASSGGGIKMNNGDIVEANGIYFSSDVSDNNGEGLLFLKSGRPPLSSVYSDYYNFRINGNGTALLNDTPVLLDSTPSIWSGGVYLQDGQTVTPTKKLSECPNGWVLVWSDYNYGEGSNDIQWAYSVVHKGMANEFTGGSQTYFLIPTYVSTSLDEFITKTCTIYDNRIVGDQINDDRTGGGWNNADRTDVVLRRIYAF